MDEFVVNYPQGYIPSANIPLQDLAQQLSNYQAYEEFFGKYGPDWRVYVNPNTARCTYIGGQGIPAIPGFGNSLTLEDLNLKYGDSRRGPTVDDVEVIVRNFILENHELFQLDDRDLALMPGSGFYGENDYLVFLNFQILHRGVPVKNSIFQVRLNHGNIVDMGFTPEYAPPAIDPVPIISSEEALDRVRKHIGGFTPNDVITNPGFLWVIPYYRGDDSPVGTRIGHRLIWEIDFHREDVEGSWQVWVDAHSGELVRLVDINAYDTYKKVHGQIYQEHVEGGTPLIDRGFPYVEVSKGLFSYYVANLAGLYPFDSSTWSTDLSDGRFCYIVDECGNPDLQDTDDGIAGDMDFGGTPMQDCNTTGANHGDATESALMTYYHVTHGKITMATYLKGHASWITDSLKISVNNAGECNAWYMPAEDTIKFFQSLNICNSTGLLAGIILHEAGHGLDFNDNSPETEMGSREVYADANAMIYTANSCIGEHFFTEASGRKCYDLSPKKCKQCTGVRECDYNRKDPPTPSTVAGLCGNCPLPNPQFPDCIGPCGRECHCTSYYMCEVTFDLVARDLQGFFNGDLPTAWEHFARLFYLSRPTSGSMFACACPIGDSCAASNWLQTFKVVDDDDGNLANGTPRAAAIFAAFDRHGIGCGAVGDPENQNSGTCPSLDPPVLDTIEVDRCELTLSWSPVEGASEYWVFRNEMGASEFMVKIGTLLAPGIRYVDTAVTPGVTYYYRVQAVTDNPSCFSKLSTVQSAVPAVCSACGIPDPPGGVDCTGGSGVITVDWNDDGTGDLYRVYRQRLNAEEWVNVSGDLPAGTTSFQDANLRCVPVEYNYRVASVEMNNGPCESFEPGESGFCAADCVVCPMTVDVTPDGTTTVCPTGQDVVFTTTTVDGVGPYTYQWTEDGNLIPGATLSTLTVNHGDAVSHAYNCRVSDSSGNCWAVVDPVPSVGIWTDAPTFGGVTWVMNTGLSTCAIELAWSPATALCAGPIVYRIYRSTDPEFVPGPASWLITVSGTSHTDSDNLTNNRTYYYVVRAEDQSTGVEDTNLVKLSGTTGRGSDIPGTWTDDGGDTTARLYLEGEWHVSSAQNHTGSGQYSYHSDREGYSMTQGQCAAATTPPLELQAATSPVLSYWVRYNLQDGRDGVVVELSNNGGTTWWTSNPQEAYTGSFQDTGFPPTNGCSYLNWYACFSGPPGNKKLSEWTQYTHDLSGYAGQPIQIRWRYSSDPGLEYEGFFLDDIQVTFASVNEPCYCPIGAGLPRTGQTTCYNEAGAQISCTGTGQDGDIRAGVAWPDPRFTDNGDGTISDELTGLTWLADGNCLYDGLSTWQDYLVDIAALADGHASCGLTDGSQPGDWRMPNVLELESLYNAGVYNSKDWLMTQGFSNIQGGGLGDGYRASTMCQYISDSAFTVSRVDLAWGYVAHGGAFVWAVRGNSSPPAQLWRTGQEQVYAEGDDGDLRKGRVWPDPRFTDNADGTVTDNLTGLIWLKNTDCAGVGRTWTTGFADISQLNADGTMNGNNCQDTSNGGGHQTDWRMPNRKELISLVEWGNYPHLASGHPFLDLCAQYWSSTSFRGRMDWAWILSRGYFLEITHNSKTSTNCIWPVRTGFKSLVVSKTGTGYGTVTSSPSGIDCGGTCTAAYFQNTQVSLSAEPQSGSEFIAWGGDCDASGHVVVDSDKTCVANFAGICTMTVDVTPNGTTTVCGGESIVFTVSPSGGTPPYTYQWTRDDDPIPGATDPTYTASYVTAQSHDYNCKVSDSWCCVDIEDSADATGEWVTQPGSPSIAAISDDDDCAQSGVTVSFVAGVDALRHDLVVDEAIVATGISSPHQHDPGDAVSHIYIVRAVNGDCEEDSEAQAFTDADNSIGAPAITGITDNDNCAQDGVTITFIAGAGATGHDLWVGGNEVMTGVTSPVSFDPGDTITHDYVVRASNALCTADSAGYPFVDIDETPVPPGAPTVTDTCNGLLVSWGSVPPATSYNVYRRSGGCSPNGWSAVASGLAGTSWEDESISAGIEYGYYIEAVNACGTATEGRSACGEAVNQIGWPGAPGITAVTDPLPGARTGLQVSFLGGAGAQSHDLWMDGHWVATGITSPHLYNPGNCSVHNFVVRAVNGICTTDSVPQPGQDDGCEGGTPPPVGDGGVASGDPMTMSKSGANINYAYDDTTCYSNVGVMLYGALGDFSGYAGAVDCDGDGTFDASAVNNAWFNLVWVSFSNIAGHPGYDGEEAARTWSASGKGCGITGDDPGDATCD